MDSSIQETKDYKIFKNLKGNRPVEKQHVRELIASFTDRGNLIKEFPVVVNEHMEIIDGQHRIAALKELGWPVAYRIEPGLNIDTVRNINSAQKNWNWLDYAHSYAALGNDNYRRLLQLHEWFHVGYHVLARYCAFDRDRTKRGNIKFASGNLELTPEAKERAWNLLSQAKELVELLEDKNITTIWPALYIIFQSPDYDHKRMVQKFTNYGDHLKTYNSINDQLRALEDIYNFNVKNGSEPVRLF